MECYICHELIERHEFTRHVGSHLAGNSVGGHTRPVATLPTFSYDAVSYHHFEHDHPLRPAVPDDQFQSEDLKDFAAQLGRPDNRQRSSFTPSRPPAHTTAVSGCVSQQETQGEKPTQLNAFQLWLKNLPHDSPKYTIIDGQESQPDLQAHEWIQSAEFLRSSSKEEVVKIVKQFEGLSSCDKKICSELVRKAPIFPGLVAYTYTHLIACPRRGWFSNYDWSSQLSELKRLVERWSQHDDTRCILSCDSIKGGLLKILRETKVNPEEHKCNSALLNGTMLLDHDIRNLAALAALCVTGAQKEDILNKHEDQVDELVELFHNLLEANIELEGGYRRGFFNALVMFSKASGYCPSGIYLAKGSISGLVSESEGQGGFGEVFKGKIGSRLVAIKKLKRSGRVSLLEYQKQLSKEAIVWRHLRHPNCLPLYGIYSLPADGPHISTALVSPWMDQGTLFKYLKHNPNADRTKLILDVVRGLDYLHSMKPHVAHRDIKPDNILITNKGRACLADFGLVSTFDTDEHFHTAPSQVVMCGTRNYMAPEIWNAGDKEAKRKVNKRACDMYALGCTIYAVYVGGHPSRRLLASVMSGKRPEFPHGTITPDMRSFVENLLDLDPLKRLTARMALDWMEVKACQEHVNSSPAPLEEEWEWRGPPNDKCLWSVPF